MLFLSPVSDINVMDDRCMFVGGNGSGLKGVKNQQILFNSTYLTKRDLIL